MQPESSCLSRCHKIHILKKLAIYSFINFHRASLLLQVPDLIWFIWIPISYGNVKAILPGVHTTYLQCINAIYVPYNTIHVQIQHKTQRNTNRYTTQQYTDNTRQLPRSAVVCSIYISWCQYRSTYIMYIGQTIRTQVSIAHWWYIQCHWNSNPRIRFDRIKADLTVSHTFGVHLQELFLLQNGVVLVLTIVLY